MKTTGMLFDTKRFALHDGPGIRTTLFLKGCSMHCPWCHNPESIASQPQLAYYEQKCIDCGECVVVCPTHAHAINDAKHTFDRTKCRVCGACEPVCLGRALKLYGRSIDVEKAVEIAIEDRDFFGTEGGVTLSGGEPLLQAEFCAELLRELKRLGIHTAVDTCGHVSWHAFEKVLPATDLFLYDFKHSDSMEHCRLTGQSNDQILSNLKRLSGLGASIEVRLPLIPSVNDSEANLRATGQRLSQLKIARLRIIPYHDMARSKYTSLNLPDTLPSVSPPDDDAVYRAVGILRSCGINAS